MEGIELAKAYVQIVPSAEGISNGIKDALGVEMESAGNNAGKTFSSSFKDFAVAGIAAGAAAVTASIGAVFKTATKVASVGDEIDKTSQKLGVTAEEYQTMSYAAEHAGFSVSVFQTAAKKLATTDFSGSVWDAIDAITAIEDPAERAAEAEALLGTNAAMQMAALINGGESLSDYKTSLEELGGLMSNEAVSASASFEDSLTDLHTALGGMQTDLAADFLPAISNVVKGITAIIVGDSGGLELIKTGIADFMANLGAKVSDFAVIGTDIVVALIDAVIDNLPQLLESGVEIMVSIIAGIVKAIPKLVAKIPEIITAIVKVFGDGAKEFISIGANIVDGVWQGIKGAAASFTSKIKGFFSDIVSSVKETLGIHSPSKVFADSIGKFIPAGIAEGINENASLVTDALDDISADSVASVDLRASSSGAYASMQSTSNEAVIMQAAAQIVAAIRQIPPASFTIGDRDIVQSYRRGVQLMGSTSIGGIA